MAEGSVPNGFYEASLAGIHDRDYGHIARAAATTAITELRRLGHETGPVVDLGCGSGIASEIIANAGFDVLGIDTSPSMVEIAKSRCSSGTFLCESIYASTLPDSVVAVVAAGEVFNYQNEGNPAAQLLGLLRRVHDSLTPGGFLLFDVAAPGRSGATAAFQEVRIDDETLMTVEVTESGSNLTRTITLIEGTRRATEVHRLYLWPDTKIAGLLATAGFSEAAMTQYVDLQFNPGWSTWLARKSA